MMLADFRQRSYELENIDRGTYTAEEYEGCIVELQRVNQWLGDARVLRHTLLREIQNAGLQKFSVLDVGAGSGELLRVTAAWARSTGRAARLTGLELNATSAQALLEESQQFPEINSVRGTAFQLPFADHQFDYTISSLFTHHFTDSEAVVLLREMGRVASRGIYVIDLHRHPIAYYLYTTVGRLILHNRLLREDGALSIRRSFKPAELLVLASSAGLVSARVERRFPYRLVLSASLPSSEADSLGPSPGLDTAVKAA
ncbi:MAG TPA: methyltransferase domain-containing protein [Pyrinomonadaceae bacterium]|nr:methyltransferase domain-containing protein [Pyrinomonadaceae bacterium]